MRAQLEAQTERQDTLAEQNGVELLQSLYALHHQQDDTRPSMMEVTNQDQHLYLCTQKEHQSDTEYLKVFQNAVDAINDSGGMAGATRPQPRMSRTKHRLRGVARGDRAGWEPDSEAQEDCSQQRGAGEVPRSAGGVGAAQQAPREAQNQHHQQVGYGKN